MPEVDLHKTVIIPLLKRRGFQFVRYTHGSTEQGKDILYIVTDHHALQRLEVCQVKNTPFSSSAGSNDSLAVVMNQLRTCREVEVLNPLTNKRELPHGVVLLNTYPLEDQHSSNMGHALAELARLQITILPPERLAEQIVSFLPEIVRLALPPDTAFTGKLLHLLNSHEEHAAFGTDATRTLDSFFVTLSLSATHSFLRKWLTGNLKCINRKSSRFTEIAKPKFDCLIGMQRALESCLPRTPLLQTVHGTAHSNDSQASDEYLAFSTTSEITVKDIRVQALLNALHKYIGTQLSAPESSASHFADILYHSTGVGFLLQQLDHTFGRDVFPDSEATLQDADAYVDQSVTVEPPPQRIFNLTFDPIALGQPREDICITGEPGAGKTSFTRAIARTLLNLRNCLQTPFYFANRRDIS